VHRKLMGNLNRHSIPCKSFPQLSVYDQDCRPRDGVALRSYCRNTHDIIPPPFHLQHQVPRSASQNVGMASCRDFASGTSRHVRVRTFKGKQGRALGRAVTDQGNVWRCANGSLLLAGHCGSFAGRPPEDKTMTTERVTPGLSYHTLTVSVLGCGTSIYMSTSVSAIHMGACLTIILHCTLLPNKRPAIHSCN
jgi:hypothetical protein